MSESAANIAAHAGPRCARGRALLGRHGLPVLALLWPGRCRPAAGSGGRRDRRLGASSGFRISATPRLAPGPGAAPSRRRQGGGPPGRVRPGHWQRRLMSPQHRSAQAWQASPAKTAAARGGPRARPRPALAQMMRPLPGSAAVMVTGRHGGHAERAGCAHGAASRAAVPRDLDRGARTRTGRPPGSHRERRRRSGPALSARQVTASRAATPGRGRHKHRAADLRRRRPGAGGP